MNEISFEVEEIKGAVFMWSHQETYGFPQSWLHLKENLLLAHSTNDMQQIKDYLCTVMSHKDLKAAGVISIKRPSVLSMLGVINIPAVALGIFSGGLLMKRMKLNIMEAAKFAFGTSLIGYFLSLIFFAMSCDNAKVAGVTISYNR